MTTPHIVLRLGAKVVIRGEQIDVIAAHNSVFEQAGYIAVAKFGKGWAADKCQEYVKGMETARRPRLIIAVKVTGEFSAWSAPLNSVFPATDERARHLVVPNYYQELANRPLSCDAMMSLKPSMWFVTTARFKPMALGSLKLVSNDRPLIQVLRETRTPMMLVTEASLSRRSRETER